MVGIVNIILHLLKCSECLDINNIKRDLDIEHFVRGVLYGIPSLKNA